MYSSAGSCCGRYKRKFSAASPVTSSGDSGCTNLGSASSTPESSRSSREWPMNAGLTRSKETLSCRPSRSSIKYLRVRCGPLYSNMANGFCTWSCLTKTWVHVSNFLLTYVVRVCSFVGVAWSFCIVCLSLQTKSDVGLTELRAEASKNCPGRHNVVL